jgi:hypothetical protein
LFGDDINRTTGEALILPGTVRLINDEVPLPTFPGIYKVIYTIGLGDTPAQVEARYMIYAPPAAIIVGIFILVLCFSIVSEYRKRRKKKASQSAERPYKSRK